MVTKKMALNMSRTGERAEGDRVVEHRGEERDTEAKRERGDEEHLVALEAGDVIEEARHAEQADDENHDEENGELQHLEADLAHAGRAGLRETGEKGEQDDGEDVLDDENAEDDLGEFFARLAEFRERLDDDRGRGDGKHRAEEDAVHGAPAEEAAAHLVAEPDHKDDFEQRGDERGEADLGQLAQAEFEPEREHEQDDAHVAQGADGVLVLHQREGRRVGADDESGDDVPERDRLLEPVAQDGHDARDEHDHGEVVEEFNAVHGADFSDEGWQKEAVP